MSLTSRLLRQPKTRYNPTPDDLTVLKSGLVMVKGPDDKVRDELDHLWYQVEEREAGEKYPGYKVVELLMLRYLLQDAKRDTVLGITSSGLVVSLTVQFGEPAGLLNQPSAVCIIVPKAKRRLAAHPTWPYPTLPRRVGGLHGAGGGMGSGNAKGVIYTITPDSLKAARFAFLDLTTSGQALARFVFQPAPDDQQNEREALRELAQRERRDPQDQADLVICDSLQRAGLLAADALTPVAQAMQHAEAQHA